MLLLSLLVAVTLEAEVKKVTATVQTQPVTTAGDSADDPAIWIDPVDPGESLILGTNKQAGLGVYSLHGEQRQFLADGRLNNVDVRQNIPMVLKEGTKRPTVDLAAAGSRDDASMYFYRIHRKRRELEKLKTTIKTGLAECYGFCLYRPSTGPNAGKLYAFVNDTAGKIEQWLIEADPTAGEPGGVKGTLARTFAVKSRAHGMVADDDRRILYLGEEKAALWRLDADPDAPPTLTAVDWTKPKGRITSDIEGVAVYLGKGDTGYVIASSKGANSYLVYRREGKNEYAGEFQITGKPTIDGVEGSEGVDVTSASLGPLFPLGAFIAQDGVTPGKKQNFKLVPWDSVAGAFQPALQITPTR